MKNRLKQLRLQNELTLTQVAKALNVVESTIQRYESGAIENLKYDTIVNLANLYHVTPTYLMGWSDDPKPYDPLKGANWDKLGDLFKSLDPSDQEQLVRYAEFLMSQKEKL